MKTKRPMKLTDQIRQIVKDCGQTRYAISKATGIAEPVLCRLVSGERFLSAEALDTLADYLGLELVKKRKAKRPASRRKD